MSLPTWILRALVAVVLAVLVAGCTSGPTPPPVPSGSTAAAGPTAGRPHATKSPRTMPSPKPSAPKPVQKPRVKKPVYLTFDDGPDPRWTPKILKELRAHDAHATFFELGAAAHSYPRTVDKVRASGSTIGSHTWHHYDLTRLSNRGIDAELRSTERALDEDVQCVRPPYGATSSRVRSRIRASGAKQVLWDVDPRDWSRPGDKAIARRVLGAVQPGSVVLMHDGGGNRSQTVEALGHILDELDDRSYSVVAMAC